jgi:hypothetical protein
MAARQNDLLEHLAKKYVWWQSPNESRVMVDRVVAQVMNIGDFDDVLALINAMGEDKFREVLTHAEIGQFNARSWTYWHYRLGLANAGKVPSLPSRNLRSSTVFARVGRYVDRTRARKRRRGSHCEDFVFCVSHDGPRGRTGRYGRRHYADRFAR